MARLPAQRRRSTHTHTSGSGVQPAEEIEAGVAVLLREVPEQGDDRHRQRPRGLGRGGRVRTWSARV